MATVIAIFAHTQQEPQYELPKIIGMGWGFDGYFVFDADRAQHRR